MEPPADPSRVIKWTKPATFNAPPPARGGHTANIVGNLLVIFGGTRYSGGGKFEYFDDVWALNLDDMTCE